MRLRIHHLSAALLATVAGAGLVVHAPAAQAQDFPSRPIRWVVPFLAATSPDTTVRIVAEAMSPLLRQPIVVDNKPGASGNVGAQLVARAPADGYTWIYAATSMSSSMRMYRKPGFDALKDFIHVGRIGISDLTVVVSPESGIKTLQQLIERGKAAPGKLTFGSGGVGSPAHMAAALVLGTAGVQALHVPYKGASESTTAVIGKQIDLTLAISSVVIPHVESGRLVPLAVSGTRRNARLPQVPTLSEAGLTGVSTVSFGGLSVPAGTPPAIVRRLSETLNKVLGQPEVRAKIEAQGSVPAPGTPEEFRDALAAEIALTERMMKAANIEPQ